jgi:hypothetical protein
MLELTALSKEDPTLTINEWDAQNGLVYRAGPNPMGHPEETNTTSSLLEYIQNYKQGNTIFVLKDFHLHFDKILNIRLLRNAWNKLKR